MTSTEAAPIAGLGVYIEARRSSGPVHYTAQLILMPEHAGSPFIGLYRRLSNQHTRKMWKTMTARTSTTAVIAASTAASPISKDALCNEVTQQTKTFIASVFDNFQTHGYVAHDPIVFEVTAEDINLVRLGKTPYKAIGRINKARKFLKYPVDIVTSPAPVGPAGPTGI